MNAGAYDEQVRSIINGRLRGMGKRLSSYCDAVVAGGDIGELSREFTDDIDESIEEGVRDVWAVSESMRREMQEVAKRRKRKAARDAAIAAALLLALQSFLSRKERVMVEQMKENFARQTRSAMSLLSGDSKTQARQLAEYIKNPSRINIDKVGQSEGETPVLQSQPSLFSRMRKILTTDIATAYRTAEYHVWQKLPFVVGQEVRLGKKHPVPDICDDLQGIYPKDFMFTGWHPWCRCFARPIFSWESDKITDMPECFNEWMVKNADKIERAREKGTLPRFLIDNKDYMKLDLRIERMREYRRYLNDANYRNVEYNSTNGGLMATHLEHKTHPNDNQRYFPEQLTGDDLENEFQRLAFSRGHSVIFRAESESAVGLDMDFDGVKMDLVSVTENSTTFRNQLGRKNDQLTKYNLLHNEVNDSLCMYFHEPSYYSYEKVEEGLNMLKDYGVEMNIKNIYILLNDESDMFRLYFP